MKELSNLTLSDFVVPGTRIATEAEQKHIDEIISILNDKLNKSKEMIISQGLDNNRLCILIFTPSRYVKHCNNVIINIQCDVPIIVVGNLDHIEDQDQNIVDSLWQQCLSLFRK